MDYKIFDTFPENIPLEIVNEAKTKCYAIICRTPREHPSECIYLVIGHLGNRLAKFRYQAHAVEFVLNCL